MAPKRDLWIRSQTVKRQKFEAVLSLIVRGDADATSLERTFRELSNLLTAHTEEAVGKVSMDGQLPSTDAAPQAQQEEAAVERAAASSAPASAACSTSFPEIPPVNAASFCTYE